MRSLLFLCLYLNLPSRGKTEERYLFFKCLPEINPSQSQEAVSLSALIRKTFCVRTNLYKFLRYTKEAETKETQYFLK